MSSEIPLPDWIDGYPDQEQVRHEVKCMAESFVETLLEKIPNDQIRALYLKGSAKKRWDTPIDYVPEASDLDMHLWFCEDDGWREHIGTVRQAVAIQQGVEQRYFTKVQRPVHTPRPQLMILNELVTMPRYMDSPRSTVQILYGERYPDADYTNQDGIRRDKCEDLIEHATFLVRFPLNTVDRPGKYVSESLRILNYRVSPAGPIVVHLSGVDAEEAWSMNRTTTVRALREVGHAELANEYVRYYLARWKFFLSNFEDFESARVATYSAIEVIRRAESIAKKWRSENDATDREDQA